MKTKKRCPWVSDDPVYLAYHDNEWGRPVHDDRQLFEKLILDGFQAGLSWITVLKKRENFKHAFDDFDPEVISTYDEKKVQELMNNSGIIRNRLKIEATIANAKAYLALIQRSSFNDFLWSFTNGRIIRNLPETIKDYKASSPQSDAMSKALKKAGFKFVGTTICYAFMQAVGMVNDHSKDCFCSKEFL